MDSEEVIIRDGRVGDGELLVPVWRQLMEYHRKIAKADFDMVEDAATRWVKYFKTNVRSRTKKAVVAERDGTPIGYLLGGVQKRPPLLKVKENAYIGDVAVLESERGRGVGSRLVGTFIEWALLRGLKFVSLNVVPENEAGRRFWERHGFETQLLNKRRLL